MNEVVFFKTSLLMSVGLAVDTSIEESSVDVTHGALIVTVCYIIPYIKGCILNVSIYQQ